MGKELITIKEFAKRTSIGMTKAREIAQSKEMFEKGVSHNLNPLGMQRLIRLDWEKYNKYLGGA